MRITISSNTKQFLDNLHPSKTESKYYNKIMEIMYGKICREHIPLDEFMEIPQNYWREVINSAYGSYLKQLIQYGVIESENSYSTITHTSKKYRINQDLAYSSPMLVKFDNRAKKLHNTKDPIIKQTISNLQKITTTYRTDKEMKSITQSDVNYQYLIDKGLKVGIIPQGKFKVYSYNEEKRQNQALKSYPLESSKIWFIAEEMELQPIFWKGRIYLTDDTDTWVQKKLIEIQHYYLESLKNLRYIRNRKNIICVRNTTNNRLDTNLTSAPSKLIQYLRINNQPLINADVKNSQLAFFSRSTFFLNRLFNYNKLVKDYPEIKEQLISTIGKDKGLNIVKDYIDILLSRGICNQVLDKEEVFNKILTLANDCHSDDCKVIHEKNASGKTYEFLAEKLYDSRYKDTFSKCATFKELENRIKYATDLKTDGEGVDMPYRKINHNQITFSRPLEQYKSEFKAIRADAKVLTFGNDLHL